VEGIITRTRRQWTMTFRPRGMFNCVRYISIKDYNRLTSRDGDAGLSLYHLCYVKRR